MPYKENPKTKKCCRCGKVKLLSEFYKCRSRKDGHTYDCKVCNRKRGRSFRQNNAKKIAAHKKRYQREHREKVNDASRRWARAHPESRKESWRKWWETHKTDNWPAWVLRNVINGARRRKRLIELSKEDIMKLYHQQRGLDAYTGVPMEISAISNNPMGVSVDRIDSQKGYVVDNVCLCCAWVNKAKGAMTKDKFMEVLMQVATTLACRENMACVEDAGLTNA